MKVRERFTVIVRLHDAHVADGSALVSEAELGTQSIHARKIPAATIHRLYRQRFSRLLKGWITLSTADKLTLNTLTNHPQDSDVFRWRLLSILSTAGPGNSGYTYICIVKRLTQRISSASQPVSTSYQLTIFAQPEITGKARKTSTPANFGYGMGFTRGC